MSDNDTNTSAGTHQPTAAQAYARHAGRIGSILGWVESELEAHAARHQAQPRNWGLVGDLAEMEDLLRRALGHISGMDEHHVDRALDDLEQQRQDDRA